MLIARVVQCTFKGRLKNFFKPIFLDEVFYETFLLGLTGVCSKVVGFVPLLISKSNVLTRNFWVILKFLLDKKR